VDDEGRDAPELTFAASALKRQHQLDFDEDDLERIIRSDPFVTEMDQPVDAGPDDSRIYRALGWTRSGHHLEVMFVAPYYGGGFLVIHAMPYPRR
jgi:hypothetical protein